jgi:hypothetical protein
MVAMIMVVMMMAVVATIFVRLRRDRRGNHGRNKGYSAEQFHSGHHFGSWRYVTRTDQGKTGSGLARLTIIMCPASNQHITTPGIP